MSIYYLRDMFNQRKKDVVKMILQDKEKKLIFGNTRFKGLCNFVRYTTSLIAVHFFSFMRRTDI
jgi:hypothetical protein